MKVIAIANQKGGVGKTTTSVNLAAALAASGQRILLCDLDSQANATSVLGLGEATTGSLYHALIRERAAADLILPTRLPNLSGIPPISISRAPKSKSPAWRTTSSSCASPSNRCGPPTPTIHPPRCPPSLGILMSNALAAADEILVPIQCEYYASKPGQTHAGDRADPPVRRESPPRHVGAAHDDVRHAHEPQHRGRQRRAQPLPGGRLQHDHPAQHPPRRGPEPRPDHPRIRPERCRRGSYRNLATEFLDRQNRQLSFVTPS